MIKSLAAVSLLVPDYDEGLERGVVVAPPGGGARIVLAVPGDERRRGRIGDQTGRRVGHFLLADDFENDMPRCARGMTFLEAPREDRYGTVAIFIDPWGGEWDLLQPAGGGDRKASAPR